MHLAAVTVNDQISLGSAGTFIMAVATLIGVFRTKANVATVKSRVDDTHDLVNGQSDRQDARIDQLVQVVAEATGTVPPAPAIPPTPPPA